jgi:LacI family transcriptional regulator
MARVTLKTIAAETGLSKFAVSRALSGKSGVSEATRAMVVEVAARLGYRRPAAIESKPLGVVFNDTDVINSELHMQIQGGVQREAHRLGFSVRVHWTHSGDDLEAMARSCSGLMLCGPHDRAAVARACAVGVPIVRQGWLDPLEPADQIGGTDHEAGTAVANYLLGFGHREIAYVHGDPRYRGRMERLYGLREALERVEGTVMHDMVWEDEGGLWGAAGSSRGGFAAAFDRLRAAGGRPTAYFCAHDGLAVTVISELLARGIRIPEDASVVGFGDFSAASQILPRLTTVKVFGADIGAMAVRLLDARINTPDYPTFPVRVLIPARIIERQSVGPAKPVRAAPRAAAGGRRPPS